MTYCRQFGAVDETFEKSGVDELDFALQQMNERNTSAFAKRQEAAVEDKRCEDLERQLREARAASSRLKAEADVDDNAFDEWGNLMVATATGVDSIEAIRAKMRERGMNVRDD